MKIGEDRERKRDTYQRQTETENERRARPFSAEGRIILTSFHKIIAVIQLIESRRKSQNHACAFSQLPRDQVLQYHFYGAHWKDKFKPKKNSIVMEN
eukprot:sb/3479013/